MTFRKASFQAICAGASLLAQACVQYYPAPSYPPPPQPPPYPPQEEAAAPAPAPAVNTSGPLDPLLAPIALYPDPLIALILPASTAPADISAASAYLVQYGDMSRIDSQPWDPSVRALAHYPTVITWMAENIAWTQALGSAFASSPADVMDSVQRLRARAQAAGTLTSTPQQQVLSEDGDIEILPAQPDSVYIPVYDPDVVYSDEPYSEYGGPFINFGTPYPMGIWLSYCFDWHHHRVWAGGRDPWHAHGGWNPPRFDPDHAPPGATPWHPRNDGRRNPQPGPGGHAKPAPLPRPMPGAPNPPPSHYRQPQGAPSNPQARLASPVRPHPATAAPPVVERRPPESAPRYAPQQAPSGVAENAPAPGKGTSPAPAARVESAHEAASPPAHAAPARESAPEPAKARPSEGAPRSETVREPAPAAAPTPDPKSH